MSSSDTLNLSDFNFDVPAELIAQKPLAERCQSRLLVFDTQCRDASFRDLPKCLPPKSLLIINNTKVFSCRLIGAFQGHEKDLKRGAISSALVEVFILAFPVKELQGYVSPCFVKPGKKFSQTEILLVGETKITIKRTATGFRAILPFKHDDEILNFFATHGQIPLPPYIKRPMVSKDAGKEVDAISLNRRQVDRIDQLRYQTVYAEHVGSVAAPTAGLHFQEDILKELAKMDITLAPITLHVGAGTFVPVKSQDISSHHMHEEMYFVPSSTFCAIKSALENKQPIFYIGTTSLRCVESFFIASNYNLKTAENFVDKWMATSLFIYPKTKSVSFEPFVGNGIITNFHQPQSTLYMLMCALFGQDRMQQIYRHAVENKYRFFSYGDSNLYFFPKNHSKKF